MLKYAALIGLILAFNINAESTSMSDSMEIARTFCNVNIECADILALELDSAFNDGVKDSNSSAQWNTLINRKAKSWKDLCDKAPSKNICMMYRDQLMARYMAGLSSK